MTPADFLAARKALGLSQHGLAGRLGHESDLPYLVTREVERLQRSQRRSV